MIPATPPEGAVGPRWRPLEERQRRVLGVLIEKAKTTPAGYPMSVNAIVAGCNQKNNRAPITAYDDSEVTSALEELQTLGAVQEIDWVGRVPKYKHLAYEWLGVKPVELAVMAELLLRGAQALGDLRARAARMEPIGDLAALRPIVEGLLERKLMVELTAPGRGQIVSHNLYTPQERSELDTRYGSPSGGHAPARTAPPERETSGGLSADRPQESPSAATHGGEQVSGFRAEISELRRLVADLAVRLEKLETESRGGGPASS